MSFHLHGFKRWLNGQGHRKETYRAKQPGPTGLTETEPPTKEHAYAWTTPRPHTHVADAQLGLHVGPQQLGVGAISDSLCCLPLDPFPLAGLPCLVSVGEDALSPDET